MVNREECSHCSPCLKLRTAFSWFNDNDADADAELDDVDVHRTCDDDGLML